MSRPLPQDGKSVFPPPTPEGRYIKLEDWHDMYNETKKLERKKNPLSSESFSLKERLEKRRQENFEIHSDLESPDRGRAR